MKKFLKELYGTGMLFFYFLKWPYLLVFGYLYIFKNFRDNYILDILWLYCLFLIIKDFIYYFRYGNRCKKDKNK